MINLDEILIRSELKPGDMGYVIYLHGTLYNQEYGYGLEFEKYVAKGVLEFWKNYDPRKDRVWICEHDGQIIGSLFLMNRGEEAQLR